MLLLYKAITYLSSPLLSLLLLWRKTKSKEHPQRLYERQGSPSLARPNAPLIWIHAASVGEAQSALIMIETISATQPDIEFLVTSGTVTSSALMAKRLPYNAVHQFMPLDHPNWVNHFLNHWQPDLVLWMESELWPNMLGAIKEREIPAALLNARMSDRSFKRWRLLKSSARTLLSTFDVILTQTDLDKERFDILGAEKVIVSDNLKYSAATLPCDADDLAALQKSIGERPVWLYASTHNGEETLAARVHTDLAELYPDLLTILVPRHPERRDSIENTLHTMGLKTQLRGEQSTLPNSETEIYIADTLGELGLFYTLSPIAMIGRSFSNDGGGGHNPIEAAQLNCAVLTGPHVQNQTQLFNEMLAAKAAQQVISEQELLDHLKIYLNDKDALNAAIHDATTFAQSKNNIIHNVMGNIQTFLPSKNKDAAS